MQPLSNSLQSNSSQQHTNPFFRATPMQGRNVSSFEVQKSVPTSLTTKLLVGALASGFFAVLGFAAHKSWNMPATVAPNPQGLPKQTLGSNGTCGLSDNSTISASGKLPDTDFLNLKGHQNQTLESNETCSLHDSSTIPVSSNLPVSNLNVTEDLFKSSINASNVTNLIGTETLGVNTTTCNPRLPLNITSSNALQLINIDSTSALLETKNEIISDLLHNDSIKWKLEQCMSNQTNAPKEVQRSLFDEIVQGLEKKSDSEFENYPCDQKEGSLSKSNNSSISLISTQF